jgi:phosphoglycerate dehydrogenase-like enzyme
MKKTKLLKKIAICSRSLSANKILRSEINLKYDNVRFNDEGLSLKGQLLIDFLKDCTHVITALEVIDENILSQLPELKVISKYGVGVDMIDMRALSNHNIRLGWVGGVNRRSVSELVISFAISLLRNVASSNREVISGIWQQNIGENLTGKTIGIIGCGYVGKDLVELLQPFKCKIIVNDIRNYDEFYKRHNVISSTKEDLLAQSDIVSIHVPLDKSTKNLINAESFNLMKNSSLLINIARGGIVNESALKKALINGSIAGAAFDVFENEPPKDNELLSLDNFIATPHIGGSSQESILAMGRAAIDGIENNQLIEDYKAAL